MELILKAQKGDFAAMSGLYEANKNKVFYISYLLTGTREDAERATAYAFSEIWDNVTGEQIKSEAEFETTAINKGVFYCRSRIIKNNSKAFKIPDNNNFSNTGYQKNESAAEKGALELILKSLPDFQRFVYVLSSVGGFSDSKLAQLLKANKDTISIAKNAKEKNLNAISEANFGEVLADYTPEGFDKLMASVEDELKVTQAVDDAVMEKIYTACEPFKKPNKNKNLIIAVTVGVVVCVALILAILLPGRNKTGNNTSFTEGTNSQSGGEGSAQSQATGEFNIKDASGLNPTHYADINIKDYGKITVALDGNIAPKTVENFVKLANNKFYDGLTLHRIMEDFMMQGGDPDANGTGGSDEEIVGEFKNNGYSNNISHTRGAISMARSSAPNSASSQFFIVHKDSTFLDGNYAAFGYVTEGIEVVDKICKEAEPTDSNGTIPLDDQPIIDSIVIRNK